MNKPIAIKHLPRRAGPTEAEGQFLADLVHPLEYPVILEVGACVGLSACWLAAGNKNAIVYSVDAWELGDTPHSHKLYRDVYNLNIAYMGFADRVISVQGFSVEIASAWFTPLDFLYIDGAHDYDNVKADILAWEPFLKTGGTLAMHDINQPDVERAVQDTIWSSGRYSHWSRNERIMAGRKIS